MLYWSLHRLQWTSAPDGTQSLVIRRISEKDDATVECLRGAGIGQPSAAQLVAKLLEVIALELNPAGVAQLTLGGLDQLLIALRPEAVPPVLDMFGESLVVHDADGKSRKNSTVGRSVGLDA